MESDPDYLSSLINNLEATFNFKGLEKGESYIPIVDMDDNYHLYNHQTGNIIPTKVKRST